VTTMKKLGMLILILTCVTACGGGGSDDAANRNDSVALAVGEPATGSIKTVGEVDWYHFRAVETNSILQLTCGGEDMLPVVDYLVTVYEEATDGSLMRLWADHAPEDAAQPADLTLNIPIDEPKDIHIAVRDLLDDEAAPEDNYSLRLVYFNPATDNANFSQASDLGSVNAAEVCQTDSIEYKGDVDCFSFSVAADGVYGVQAQFTDSERTTPVNLEMKLYGEDGKGIYPTAGIQPDTNHFFVYLEAGQHYVSVQDKGRNHLDPEHYYAVCINPVSVAEALRNDDEHVAMQMAEDTQSGSLNPTYVAQDALAYQQDQDWYWIAVPASLGAEVQTLNLTFTDTVPAGNFPFQIILKGPDGDEILTHEYPGGASGYSVQVKVEEGENLIGIMPKAGATVVAGLDYTLRAEIVSVDDAAEIGDGNDSVNTALPVLLTANGSVDVEGKIAFRGDSDWYRITVPNDTDPQILGLHFLAADVSAVDYCVEVKDADGQAVAQLSKTIDMDLSTQLEASYYIDGGTDSDYYIKVCDCQNDDGADVSYNLTVATSDIPATVATPAGLDLGGKQIQYASEADERAWAVGDFDSGAEAVEVTCIIYTQLQPTFKTNQTLLDVGSLDADNQYTSDWIAGYVDYQGDQDWYMLDIKPMIPAEGGEIPSEWYYDIEVRLYVPGNTHSQVEYTWKLYRDVAHGSTPPNRMVLERTPSITNNDFVEDTDGILAGWSSPLIATATSSTIDQTVPESGEPFWVGSRWQNDRYYLSISDFNYTRSSENQLNPVPDNDWGYDAPYYFQVRLTYHPGDADPD
jgi:hypothetical protein